MVAVALAELAVVGLEEAWVMKARCRFLHSPSFGPLRRYLGPKFLVLEATLLEAAQFPQWTR